MCLGVLPVLPLPTDADFFGKPNQHVMVSWDIGRRLAELRQSSSLAGAVADSARMKQLELPQLSAVPAAAQQLQLLSRQQPATRGSGGGAEVTAELPSMPVDFAIWANAERERGASDAG